LRPLAADAHFTTRIKRASISGIGVDLHTPPTQAVGAGAWAHVCIAPAGRAAAIEPALHEYTARRELDVARDRAARRTTTIARSMAVPAKA